MPRKKTSRISEKKRATELAILEQWVEVTIENGITCTELIPSNEVLLEEAKKMDPPPLLVYRRINFPAGVPSEYGWTQPPDEQTQRYGGGCVQRMTFETWNDILPDEARIPGGHLSHTGRPAVPRPLERGGCDCPTCSTNHQALAELGLRT